MNDRARNDNLEQLNIRKYSTISIHLRSSIVVIIIDDTQAMSNWSKVVRMCT